MATWCIIPDFESFIGICYEVSDEGEVRNSDGKLVGGWADFNGYPRVALRNAYTKKIQHRPIHRLVAEAFISNPDSLPEVDHINNNRADNKAKNLKWVTRLENNRRKSNAK